MRRDAVRLLPLLAPIFAIGLSSICAATARGDLVSIAATRDATLYQSADGSIANGAGQSFFAGKTNQSMIRRALINFDVASYIPDGATITAARLTLNLAQVNGGARSVSIHRSLSSWTSGASDPTDNEGAGAPALIDDATWLYSSYDGAGGGVAWTTAGGDFGAFASDTIMTNALGLYTWSSLGILNDVRLFASDPTQNFGWFILGDESAAGTARRFDSCDSAAAGGVVPQLEIEFTSVPNPGPIALLVLAGMFASNRKRG
jgi:hypothetical protein